MNNNFVCSKCGFVTIDVRGGHCSSSIICPRCLRDGVSSIMLEQKTEKIQNLGDGFFTKNK